MVNAQTLELLGMNEFHFLVMEVVHRTTGTGEETSGCCASGTRD